MDPTSAGRLDARAALIDLDGTLVDTLGDFVAVLALTFEDLGLLPPPSDRVAHAVGQGSEHLIRVLLADAGLAPADVDRLWPPAWARYQHHYQDLNGRHARVLPGVVEGLWQLRAAGWRLACVTNKPGAFAEALLQGKQLRESFEIVLGGDAMPQRKPDPAPLREACRRLGVETVRAVMIGDSSNDARAARAAGCRCVLVRGGYNHGEPVEQAGPDGVAERFDEAVRLLLRSG